MFISSEETGLIIKLLYSFQTWNISRKITEMVKVLQQYDLTNHAFTQPSSIGYLKRRWEIEINDRGYEIHKQNKGHRNRFTQNLQVFFVHSDLRYLFTVSVVVRCQVLPSSGWSVQGPILDHTWLVVQRIQCQGL